MERRLSRKVYITPGSAFESLYGVQSYHENVLKYINAYIEITEYDVLPMTRFWEMMNGK